MKIMKLPSKIIFSSNMLKIVLSILISACVCKSCSYSKDNDNEPRVIGFYSSGKVLNYKNKQWTCLNPNDETDKACNNVPCSDFDRLLIHYHANSCPKHCKFMMNTKYCIEFK